MREIREIVADALGVDPADVTGETGEGTCPQWDSLAQVVIVARVVDELGLHLTYEQMQGARSVAALEQLANAGE